MTSIRHFYQDEVICETSTKIKGNTTYYLNVSELESFAGSYHLTIVPVAKGGKQQENNNKKQDTAASFGVKM